MNLVKVLMKAADIRDPAYWGYAEEYNMYSHIPARPGAQYSVVSEVMMEIEMALAVFNCADPVELYMEKEYYFDKPHLANEDGWDFGPYGEII